MLVGNEKTLKDSEVLLHQVKKIKPECLNGMPHALQVAGRPEHGDPDHESVRAGAGPLPAQARPAGRPDEPGLAQHRQLPGPVQPAGRRVHRPVDVQREG